MVLTSSTRLKKFMLQRLAPVARRVPGNIIVPSAVAALIGAMVGGRNVRVAQVVSLPGSLIQWEGVTATGLVFLTPCFSFLSLLGFNG
jgi:hypothetical protein